LALRALRAVASLHRTRSARGCHGLRRTRGSTIPRRTRPATPLLHVMPVRRVEDDEDEQERAEEQEPDPFLRPRDDDVRAILKSLKKGSAVDTTVRLLVPLLRSMEVSHANQLKIWRRIEHLEKQLPSAAEIKEDRAMLRDLHNRIDEGGRAGAGGSADPSSGSKRSAAPRDLPTKNKLVRKLSTLVIDEGCRDAVTLRILAIDMYCIMTSDKRSHLKEALKETILQLQAPSTWPLPTLSSQITRRCPPLLTRHPALGRCPLCRRKAQ